MNNEQEVLTTNTLMSLFYFSNTKVIASGQANQPNSESGQANQLNSESGLANQLNSESGQANQQNSKSGQANQPNSKYDKANKLKMSRKRSQNWQYKIPGLIRELITDTSNNNEWEPVEVIETEGPMKSIGKYLADLYKAASNASANTAKVIQYDVKSWYNYANKFENRVKELIKTGVKKKLTRTAVYEEIEPFLLVFSKINLCQKTHKARNILYLFSNIGVDKIQRIRTYSANNIASYDANELELSIDYVKNIVK
ncbi:hypothetical protein C2G38_2157425 [Gigaspora rosea]|uniref:Uncharacterized protein n=1 Tax=Gigaspora rosea TaxID=44941 RepID=A0A397W8L4_9GLOM|nr:hypothetical protein C2G38_2157425 [Gigaspora rosea]